MASAPSSAPGPQSAASGGGHRTSTNPAAGGTATGGGSQYNSTSSGGGGGGNRPQYAPPPANRAPRATGLAQQSRLQVLLLAGHVALIVLAVVYLLPVFPAFSYRAYKYFLQLAIVMQGASDVCTPAFC